MPIPERLTMWSSIGRGAMGTDQPCLGPCDDHALDLVRELAEAHDEAAYRAVRERARDVLRAAGT